MLLTGKRIATFVAIFGLVWLGWAYGNGYMTWNKVTYRCFGGTHFYSAVDKQQWLSVGSLHLYYQPYTWGCDADHRYDPAQYHVENGLLVGN